MTIKLTTTTMLDSLYQAWSIESSSKWSKENPAKGQCRSLVDGSWHFYNEIHGKRIDFTNSQFDKEPAYQDIRSNREEAFADTNQKQSNYLKTRIKQLSEEKG